MADPTPIAATGGGSPLRVAVVGAGPAGFYAAAQILGVPGLDAEVEMFDRLPTPYGLVRFGVSPDHPKIKSVIRVYEKTATLPGFHYHGNVTVGGDLDCPALLAHHHAVIVTVGSARDRRLDIPGEDLPGSLSATDFVAWYNGHPDYAALDPDLSCGRAVVVGAGNVALDVARILARADEELRTTDIADHALAALRDSSVEEIVVLARRGPAQAAYTSPELRELGEMADADVVVDPADVELDDYSRAYLAGPDADDGVRRNVAIATEFAHRAPSGRRRRLVLRFLASPVEILGDDRVHGVRIVRNRLVPGDDGSLRARPTDREETIEAGLVLRSVGYRGDALDGLPFDERRSVLPNDGGRVIEPLTAEPLPGLYAAGWIKRGPTGVIGTNKKDAQETVDHLLDDWREGRLARPVGSHADLLALLEQRRPGRVDWAGWQAIDRRERELGEPQGRPRVKLCSIAEMLAAARVSPVSAG